MNVVKGLVLAGAVVLACSGCEEEDAGSARQGLGPPGPQETARAPSPAGAPQEPSETAMTDYVAQARSEITPENVNEEAEKLERELRAELAAHEE